MANETKNAAPTPVVVAETEDGEKLVEVEFLRNYFVGKRMVKPGERAMVRRASLKAIEGGKPPYGKRVK